MKYGRKREFVDAEIEARMGLDTMKTVTETAKADPTVNDNLLGDTPVPTNVHEDEVHANSGALQNQVHAEGAGNFEPEKIPEAAQQAAPADPTRAIEAAPTTEG